MQGIEIKIRHAEPADFIALQRIFLSLKNEPAIRLCKRFGFVVEGILRCYAFRSGSYVDAYGVARLTSD